MIQSWFTDSLLSNGLRIITVEMRYMVKLFGISNYSQDNIQNQVFILCHKNVRS